MSEKEEESSEEFIRARYKHSAVESVISAMENHGLDLCLDVGLDVFERYVALAVFARNFQQLGSIIIVKERKQKKRSEHNRINPFGKRKRRVSFQALYTHIGEICELDVYKNEELR